MAVLWQEEQDEDGIPATNQGETPAEEVYPGQETPGKLLHDLNQPLNSIKMISGGILFLLKQGKRLSDEELADCMQKIAGQADQLAIIIRHMKK